MRIDVDPEQDFHVVIDGAVTALSLDGLDEAYQADKISDETLIWQQGLDEWMRLDDLLAVLSEQDDQEEEASDAIAPAVDANTYSVMVAPEEVKNMTLEALADAYRLGAVQDQTPVWQPGTADWVPLSVIIASFAAGQHPSQAPAPQSVAPAPQSLPAQSVAPAPQSLPAQSVAPAPQSLPAQSAAPAPQSFPPQSLAPHGAPQPSVGPTMAVAGAASVAPVASAPRSMPAALASAPNTLAPTAASIAPLSYGVGPSANANLGLDDLDVASLKGSGSWIKRSLVGAGALAAGALIYLGTSGSGSAPTAQPVGAAQPATAAPTPEVEAEPSAWEKEQALVEQARLRDEAAAKAAANKPAADAFGAVLNGESQPKSTAPAAARPKSTWKPKAKKAPAKSGNTGHSQYDPMNGSL